LGLGRLSKAEINRMIEEAAMYRQQDNLIKARIEAKHNLENYIYTLRNTLREPTVKNNLSDSDRKILEEAIQENLKWLELNSETANKTEFEKRQKNLHNLCREIFTKMCQGSDMSLLPKGPLRYVCQIPNQTTFEF
jgi:L1 cell adhesion molecule like protein